jgi:uncharacterized protein (TIGR03435 family)
MLRAIAGFILVSGAVFGQSTPAFDIADVHASPRRTNPFMTGGVLRGGRYDIHKATMVDLISTAYGIDGDKVVGGPSWLDTDRFEVIAKAPNSTAPETVKLMLQGLLAERFMLVVHNDTKPMPAFVLSLGKGKPKLKEAAEGSGPGGCQGQQQNPEPGVIPYIVVTCHNLTMQAFSQELRNMANGYLTTPVVDSTGLKGAWDFEIKWHGRGQLARAGSEGITIFDAVDKQLGLKLDPQKVPIPVIVVDSVEQKPTPNPPGVTTQLPPPPPAEFEVADIRPSRPDAQQNARLQNGRLDVQAFPLKQLVTLAWDLNTDELLAGAPKWMDSEKFDVIAKASVSGPTQDVDIDDLRLMLRALLVERFKLTTHTEERPVTAYTLTSVKPKLKKADSSNRAGCKEGPPPAAKDPRDANPVLSRLVTCQNMTMAQFADLLPGLAPGYLRTPVQDATGLEGGWDFSVNFSPVGVVQGGGRGGRGGDGPPPPGGSEVSDPNGALSLFDALNKQLGLKLDTQKRPMPVLIIDHIEEKPTEN